MLKKSAFTLSETLIMVAIVGIIASISAVSLKNLRPDKDALLIRKAYNEIARAVSDMTSDELLYPTQKVVSLSNDHPLLASTKQVTFASSMAPDNFDLEFDDDGLTNSSSGDIPLTSNLPQPNTDLGGNVTLGELDEHEQAANLDFDINSSTAIPTGGLNSSATSSNTVTSGVDEGTYTARPAYAAGSKANVFTDTTVYNSTSYTSNNKFAHNFALRFDITGTATCTDNYCTFTTKDNMYWTVTDNFNSSSGTKQATILVDINGTDKAPNSGTASNPDRYMFIVDKSGAISLSASEDYAAATAKARTVLSKVSTK